MPADKRIYITLHDGMPDHPKIGALSDKAFRVWIELLCWSSRHRTDGRIPAAWLRKVATPKVRSELLGSLIVEDGDGYALHDYLKHQRSASEIDELSRKRSEAGKKGLANRYQKASKQLAKGLANATAIATANSLQRASKPLADTEELSKDNSNASARTREAASAGPEAEFEKFYQAYPRHEAKGQARRAYKAARRKISQEVLLAGVERYTARMRREGRDQKFIALPATWLNAERWDDEYSPPARKPSLWDPEFHRAVGDD